MPETVIFRRGVCGETKKFGLPAKLRILLAWKKRGTTSGTVRKPTRRIKDVRYDSLKINNLYA